MTTIHDVVRYHMTEAKRCREHIERNGDRCPRAAYEEIATFHDECAAVLHDHLAKGAQEWRPIETAPRNRMVMLGRPNDDDYEGISLPGFWNESLEDGVDYMGNDEGFVDCMYSTFYCGRSFGNPAYQNAGFQPTHWMPLPAAPMLSQRGEVESG